MVIFIGFSFPFRKGDEFPAVSTDDQLIKESLIQLVLTGSKERIMRPSFGSNAYSYIFEDNDDLLQHRIQVELTQLIGQFEPRVALLGVAVIRGDKATNQDTQITITISYVVLATRQPATTSITLSQ